MRLNREQAAERLASIHRQKQNGQTMMQNAARSTKIEAQLGGPRNRQTSNARSLSKIEAFETLKQRRAEELYLTEGMSFARISGRFVLTASWVYQWFALHHPEIAALEAARCAVRDQERACRDAYRGTFVRSWVPERA